MKICSALIALAVVSATPAFAQMPPCPGGQWQAAGQNQYGGTHYVCNLPPVQVGPGPQQMRQRQANMGPPPQVRRQQWGHNRWNQNHGPMFRVAPIGRPCGLIAAHGRPYC